MNLKIEKPNEIDLGEDNKIEFSIDECYRKGKWSWVYFVVKTDISKLESILAIHAKTMYDEHEEKGILQDENCSPEQYRPKGFSITLKAKLASSYDGLGDLESLLLDSMLRGSFSYTENPNELKVCLYFKSTLM